jgi:GNAT superfamily N-acetyltransferase
MIGPRDRGHRRRDEGIDRWFRPVRVAMSFDSFERLPWHPAYKFEYWEGQLRISPRWQSHSVFLELTPPETRLSVNDLGLVTIRPLISSDWEALSEPLSEAFEDIPPLGMLGSRRRFWAARDWLQSTREGSEGPPIESACVVAVDREDSTALVGALLVTLMTGWARSMYSGQRLRVLPPPAEDLVAGGEQPQISWVFVRPRASDRGVGTAMLASATRSLWELGYRELASAIHRGNDASIGWHWRNGFRLLPHFESGRRPRGQHP